MKYLISKYATTLFLLESLLVTTSCGIDQNEQRFYSVQRQESLPSSFIVGFKVPRGSHKFLRYLASEERSYFNNIVSQKIKDRQNISMSFITMISTPKIEELALAEVKLKIDVSPADFFRDWEERGLIDFWEPNWLNTMHSYSPKTLGLDQFKKKDLWWAEQIRLVEAFEELDTMLLHNKQAVHPPVIAVLDSGIDYTHPALRDAIWSPPTGIDTGCRNDKFGCSTGKRVGTSLGEGRAYPFSTRGPSLPCASDENEGACLHGTHVAGIIAGRIRGGMGGICPICKIINVRVVEEFFGSGKVADASILRGLKYVSQFQDENGGNLVRLINLSFGKYKRGRSISLFIEHLSHLRNGILVVAAAGNEDSQTRIFPAAHNSVFAVGSVAASGKKASYSNFGTWVHLSAPGGEVLEGIQFGVESSIPGGLVGLSQGTSVAAPMVTGVAALVLAMHPKITTEDLKRRLIESSNSDLYRENFAGGFNAEFYNPLIDGKRYPLLGAGLLDASAAVKGKKNNIDLNARHNELKNRCGQVMGFDFKQFNYNIILIILLLPLVFAVSFFNLAKRDCIKLSRS